MVIYGVSQSTGVERQLKFDRAGAGIILTISDHVGVVERERIIVVGEDIMNVLMASPGTAHALEGEAPQDGKKKTLDIEIRRNEIWLRSHDGTAEGCDIAVGLDDFQDALEKVTAAA